MRDQVANIVTLARVVLVVPFWIAYGREGTTAAAIAVACVLLMELSDFLDGKVARRLGVVSDVGKLLDPAADSFSRLSVFLALTTKPAPGGGEPWFPAWAVAALLFRDVGVSFLRQLSAARGVVAAARLTGKLKALVQAAAIWTILGLHLEATISGTAGSTGRLTAAIACWIVVAVTLASLADYARALAPSAPPPPSGASQLPRT